MWKTPLSGCSFALSQLQVLLHVACSQLSSVCTQAPNSATSSGATSTGVFLGQQPYSGFNVSSSPAPQLYAHQIQGNSQVLTQSKGASQLCLLYAVLLFMW